MATWKENYLLAINKNLGKLTPDQEVINFINNFFINDKNNVSRKSFVCGNCYWFALILKNRFPTKLPVIWYDTINNHFVTAICGILYDSYGVYAPTSPMTIDEFDAFYIWEDYKKIDPIHAARITENCITFTKDK